MCWYWQLSTDSVYVEYIGWKVTWNSGVTAVFVTLDLISICHIHCHYKYGYDLYAGICVFSWSISLTKTSKHKHKIFERPPYCYFTFYKIITLAKFLTSAQSSIAVNRSEVFVFSSSEFCTSSTSSMSYLEENKLRNMGINDPQFQSSRLPWRLNFEQCQRLQCFFLTPSGA